MSQKIVFMGTLTLLSPLDILLKSDHKILSVYTQSTKKSKRGHKYHLSYNEKFSLEKSLNVRSPEILDTEEEYNFFKSLDGYSGGSCLRKDYSKRFLNLPKYGFINIRASILPKWRCSTYTKSNN